MNKIFFSICLTFLSISSFVSLMLASSFIFDKNFSSLNFKISSLFLLAILLSFVFYKLSCMQEISFAKLLVIFPLQFFASTLMLNMIFPYEEGIRLLGILAISIIVFFLLRAKVFRGD